MLPACIFFRGGVIGSPLMASADLVGFLREKSKAPAQRIVDHGRPGARTNTGVLLLLLAVAACTGDGLEPGSALSEVLEEVENPDVFQVEAESTVSAVEEQYDLFDQERLPTLKITLSEAAERQLIDEPRAKDYVPAQLELIDGDVDERVEVGLRLKGKGSFKPLDAKAAFRIKVNKYRKNQTLRGLKDLTLNNMMQDRSLMAERLAYHVFREMNVAAPRVNHVLVYVNDVYYGVYANIGVDPVLWTPRNARNCARSVPWHRGNEEFLQLSSRQTRCACAAPAIGVSARSLRTWTWARRRYVLGSLAQKVNVTCHESRRQHRL